MEAGLKKNILLLPLICIPQFVSAVPITYNFAGQLEVIQSPLESFFTLGEQFTAAVTVDSNTPENFTSVAGGGFSTQYNFQSLSFSSTSYSVNTDATCSFCKLTVGDTPTSDFFGAVAATFLAAPILGGEWQLTQVNLALTQLDPSTFADTALPTSLNLNLLGKPLFDVDLNLGFDNGSLGRVAAFRITNVSTSANSVTEPTTLALLSLGLFGFGFRYRVN